MRKSTTRQVTASSAKPARVKTAVCISPEAFQRIGACCIKEGMTQSEVFEFLVNRHLSGYVVSVRGDRLRDSNAGASPAIPAVDVDRLDTDGHMSDVQSRVA
jgi:hypothetical protein